MLFLSGLLETLIKFLMYGAVVLLGILSGKKIREAKDAKSER